MSQNTVRPRDGDAMSGETGPSTPVVITGGGIFGPGGERNIRVGSGDMKTPLFTVTSGDDAQWTQSRSLWAGSISEVRVGDGQSLFLTPNNTTVILFEAEGRPLFSLRGEEDAGGFLVTIKALDPDGFFKVSQPSPDGRGWVESIFNKQFASYSLRIGSEHTEQLLDDFKVALVLGEPAPSGPGAE